jgi:hypothetical protein
MSEPDQRVVIIGRDGSAMPSAQAGENGSADGAGQSDARSFAEMVSQPDKVMRIGTMIKQLLEEVRQAPLDDASRQRLGQIHTDSVAELAQGLSPDLQAELGRLTLPFGENATPSDAELRIAQAQLVGWLEGLFHGIQTALFAQQMATRQQLEEMRRRALPAGPGAQQEQGHSGPYL